MVVVVVEKKEKADNNVKKIYIKETETDLFYFFNTYNTYRYIMYVYSVVLSIHSGRIVKTCRYFKSCFAFILFNIIFFILYLHL